MFLKSRRRRGCVQDNHFSLDVTKVSGTCHVSRERLPEVVKTSSAGLCPSSSWSIVLVSFQSCPPSTNSLETGPLSVVTPGFQVDAVKGPFFHFKGGGGDDSAGCSGPEVYAVASGPGFDSCSHQLFFIDNLPFVWFLNRGKWGLRIVLQHKSSA